MFDKTNTPTVNQLLNAGFKIEITHERRYGKRLLSRRELADRDKRAEQFVLTQLGVPPTDLPDTEMRWHMKANKLVERNFPTRQLSPMGGRTVCEIIAKGPTGEDKSYVGVAVCDDGDHYIKEEGRWRSIRRALLAWGSDHLLTDEGTVARVRQLVDPLENVGVEVLLNS